MWTSSSCDTCNTVFLVYVKLNMHFNDSNEWFIEESTCCLSLVRKKQFSSENLHRESHPGLQHPNGEILCTIRKAILILVASVEVSNISTAAWYVKRPGSCCTGCHLLVSILYRLMRCNALLMHLLHNSTPVSGVYQHWHLWYMLSWWAAQCTLLILQLQLNTQYRGQAAFRTLMFFISGRGRGK